MATNKICVDPLIKDLCEKCAALSHRSLFVVKGEELSEQVVVLHHFVSKIIGSTKSSVLWCHSKDALLPKSSRKTIKSLDSKLKSGQISPSDLKPLDLLLMSTAVRFCSYSESHSVLGNTYNMCVLQDVECLTPNLLCRVVETVRGGGAVVILLTGMTDLRQLCEADMDAHYRLTTHSHPNVTKLFNTRFVLSLAWCKSCIILDDKLRVCCDDVAGMKYKNIKSVDPDELNEISVNNEALSSLQESLADATKPLPQLMGLCKTSDQAKCVMKLVDVLTERQVGEVVSVTANRGRGKSAALGLAVAAAVDLGLNNIFVTSPSPQNLTAFFQLLFAGFDALDYKEGTDYEILQSTNQEFGGAVVRVTVHREYRQTIQYVLPADHAQIVQSELVVVDEAAAIPLAHVQAMVGQHITLMASTIAGYEGTGRSLSLKLLKQLRNQTARVEAAAVHAADIAEMHTLHELTLEHSIRYDSDDPVEEWLYKLLCLDATKDVTNTISCPAPQLCNLYYVNKSVLLSGNKASEQFLLQVQSLLVSSHYRNSPDDLQVMSESAAHHLFVLLPPLPEDGNMKNIPPVLCILQVCLEGGVSASVAQRVFSKGERPPGDLVPWNLVNQFLDPSLAHHVGVRIIRIATHPKLQSMGYGSRSIGLLKDHYGGRLVRLENIAVEPGTTQPQQKRGPIGPRKLTEPMLCPLSDRVPEKVDYLSVAYGITPQLYKFWSKANFLTFYISQVMNKTTGEHSCMMVHPVSEEGATFPQWLKEPCIEFMRRFMFLLGGSLRDLHPMMVYEIITANNNINEREKEITWKEASCQVTGHSLRMLEKYSKNQVDRHLITYLLPALAMAFCSQRLTDVHMSKLQAALLVGTGLQLAEVMTVGRKLGLEPASTLGNLRTAVRRVYLRLAALQETAFTRKLVSAVPYLLTPVNITIDQDLNRIAKETEEERPDLHFHKGKRSRNHDSHNFKTNKKGKKVKRNKYSSPF